MARYSPLTENEISEMLKEINKSSIDDLFSNIPKSILVEKLNIHKGISEIELTDYISSLASKNKTYKHIFRGAMAYNHYIPSIVKRVSQKEEFVTAYTPYQAEISQGILQSIFEYQTMICNLTDMDVSNASLYDGATAAAEAIAMTRSKKQNKVLISKLINPENLETIKTYCFGNNMEIAYIETKNGKTSIDSLKELLDDNTCSVYLEQPNYYGIIEEAKEIGMYLSETKTSYIMGVNPFTTTLLKTPGECLADIAVGEGQPLGLSLSFGGPYLGFIATKEKLTRSLPGRIVGQTVDKDNKRCFVLTMQAREQHIRREKASSNICSNQAHCALTAAVYMASMGPIGMSEVAKICYDKAHYLAEQLQTVEGFSLAYNEDFFFEFVIKTNVDNYDLIEKLKKYDILGGLVVDSGILWCATERNSKEDIDNLILRIKEVLA